MKILRIISIFILTMGLLFTVSAEVVQRTAKIMDMRGKVEVKLLGEENWSPAKASVILNEGDMIKTHADSWALLNVDGSAQTATVKVEENSQLLLSELIKDDKEGSQQTLLDLEIGRVLIKAKKLHSEKSKFEVKTPTSVVGVRGTTFAVEVEALE